MDDDDAVYQPITGWVEKLLIDAQISSVVEAY